MCWAAKPSIRSTRLFWNTSIALAWLEPLLPGAVKDLQAGHRLVELRRSYGR